MKYVIWGAGERGARILPHLKENEVKAFIDIDDNKIGKEYFGKKIISFEEYKEKYSECYVIISFSHEDEIKKILEQNGLYKYFLMSECPGEFQESNPRDILKRYVCRYIKENKKYAIYGCTLYSFLLSQWIEEQLGTEVCIIPHKETNDKLLCILKKEKSEKYFKDIENITPEMFDEILVTVERDIEYLGNHLYRKDILKNIYDCSDNIREYYNPQIERFRSIHAGQRCFIVATGPSLRMEDLDILAKNHEICISMNRIWYAFDKTIWRPQYYVVGDHRFLMEDEDILEELPITYKFIADTYGPYWEKRHSESIIKYHFQYEYLPDRMPKFSADFSRKSYHGCSITYVCLQLAVYMGFTDIYLLGVDATRLKKQHDSSSHFCKEYVDKSTTSLMVFNEEPRLAYKAAKEYTEQRGINIYNATRGGELEVFTRVDFDKLF